MMTACAAAYWTTYAQTKIAQTGVSVSVAKSRILSRDLGIFLSSWDFIGIFISKT